MATTSSLSPGELKNVTSCRQYNMHIMFYFTSLQVRRLAYFDTRNKSHVSIVFLVMFDARTRMDLSLYASLVYKDEERHCLQLERWQNVGKLKYLDKEFYINPIYRTKFNENIPTDKAPLYAKVGMKCTNLTGHIPIQDKSEKRFTYGVCLHKALYDLHKPQLLVDWVELNIVLGAEIITVYLQNVSESYYTAMLPYIERGIVEVLDWNMKPPLIPGYTKHWGQTGTTSECIYRNLYRVKYLALIDVDEFIVPQRKTTVVEVLKDLEIMTKSDKPASFIFYNTWFYSNGISIPELKSSSKCGNYSWPRYFTFTQRTADPEAEDKYFIYHKIIVKTGAVVGAWYHWPVKVLDGFTYSSYVPAKDGLLHHYRVPMKRPKTKSKATFIMSKYFNVTSKYLRDCSAGV